MSAPTTYAVCTFGCRVNQADSLRFEGELRAAGARAAPPEQADVVLINTCSVTATADQGARQTIRRVARLNPAARIVATGCYATRCGQEVAAFPGVVRVVPNQQKDRLVDILGSEIELTTAERFGAGDGACGAPLEPGVGGRTAFTLRLQTGCAEQCAYCIIPSTRGVPRSLPPDEVLDRVRRAMDAGYKAFSLTGVHLGSYGRDLLPRTDLTTMLGRLAAEAGHHDVLYRLSSIEPMDCDVDIVDLVASSRCFAPHFHLPLQHASDSLLRAMRRPYGLARYSRLVSRIRALLPGAAIGTDLIAGFPGETDADLQTTIEYLDSSPLTYLHVFPYSDRPGTVASRMARRVARGAVRERARQLRAMGRTLAARFRLSQAGSVRRALTLDGERTVVTDNYFTLTVDHRRGRNQWVQVKLTPSDEGLVGTLVPA
jgi:threonylcarbamoyladenosine tRNA methylthiotransferase MtaB